MNFDEYHDMNPRPTHPKELEAFRKYAHKRYKGKDCVNATYADDEEEFSDNVDDYLSDAAEVLLLYKDFVEEKKVQE